MKSFLFILLTVVTTYSGGVFRSEGTNDAACSKEAMNQVLDSLLADFANQPARLFDWAFYGTGVQDASSDKDAFILQYDSVVYHPETEQLNLYLSVLVNHFKDIHGIVVEARLTDNRRIHGVAPKQKTGPGYTAPRVLSFRVRYSGKLVEDVHVSMVYTPGDTKQHLYIRSYCEFGKFFNLFISQKMYRNVVEWRIDQFLINLQRTAEGKRLVAYPSTAGAGKAGKK